MLKDALTVLGIGFSVVFIALLCLIGIIYLMSFIVRLVRREEKPIKHSDAPVVLPERSYPVGENRITPERQLSGPERRQLIAAVSSALAEYLGTDIGGLRICSIKRVGGEASAPNDRRELVAAISSAIAVEMGTDVSAIRIHSIKKVS